MEERLQKVISECGYASRRKAEELIKKGRVSVNGEIVCTLGVKVKPSDIICIDNITLTKSEKEYYLINKPRGVISSVSDDLERKTVVDLIDTESRIFPVGRLDYDTTGILILTNDGSLTNILTSPRNQVPKTYLVKLDRTIEMNDFYKIKDGVVIEGRKVFVKRLKLKKQPKDKDVSYIEITVIEGRNHIIKKLFKSIGYNVDKLSRIGYGNLTLGKLQSGEYRTLNKKEVHELYAFKR